jgi:hypothetical protein
MELCPFSYFAAVIEKKSKSPRFLSNITTSCEHLSFTHGSFKVKILIPCLSHFPLPLLAHQHREVLLFGHIAILHKLGQRVQLNVGGAFIDGADLCVTIEALNVVLLGEANAAKPLNGLARGLLRDLRSK